VGSFRIERHPAVIEEDLPVVYSFVAKSDEIAAERVLNAIGDTFELLAQEPDVGVLYRTANPKLHGVKMMPVTRYRNYLVFYRIAADHVRILYVVHGARNLVHFFAETPRV
jgi:toxin ParE1/3/4